MDNNLGILQGVSLSHPSTSLDKKYETLNNTLIYSNNKNNKDHSKQYTKNNNSIKSFSKLKKSSIPLKRSNSSSQISLQPSINNNIIEKKRVSSARTNRNITSSNYVFQTPWEPEETKNKSSKFHTDNIHNNISDELDNSINLDFNMDIPDEDLIKNESMPFLNNDLQNFNPNDITFPDNLSEEWDKIKQDKDIVNKIEDLSKLLFSDYDNHEKNTQFSSENNFNGITSPISHEESKNISNNNNDNIKVNSLLDTKSNSEVKLMEALQPNSINIKNDILFKPLSDEPNNNENNQTINDKNEDSIYNHSSLKETEMTIKQLDYLINNQKINNENMDINIINNPINPLIPEIENKDNVDLNFNIWDKLSPSFVEHLNHCASVIQRWYRFQSKRRQLLNEKKKEILSSFDVHNHITGENSTDLITHKINLKAKDSKIKKILSKNEKPNKNNNNNDNNNNMDTFEENINDTLNDNKVDIMDNNVNNDNNNKDKNQVEIDNTENNTSKIEDNDINVEKKETTEKNEEKIEEEINYDEDYEFEFEEYEGDDNGNESMIKIEEKNNKNDNDNEKDDENKKNTNEKSDVIKNDNNNNKNDDQISIKNNSEKVRNDDSKSKELSFHDNIKTNNTIKKLSNNDDNNNQQEKEDIILENSKSSLKKIVIDNNKTNIKDEYGGDFISNIDQISITESETVPEVELDDVINRLKCSNRNVSNQKIVIKGTIGLNIEECDAQKIDEETVKSMSSLNDNKNEMKDETVNEEESMNDNLNGKNNKKINDDDMKEESLLSYNYINNFDMIKNNVVQEVNISDYFDKKEISSDEKESFNLKKLKDDIKTTSRPASSSKSSIIDTLKELRDINKSFKKLKAKNDIESLISLDASLEITDDNTNSITEKNKNNELKNKNNNKENASEGIKDDLKLNEELETKENDKDHSNNNANAILNLNKNDITDNDNNKDESLLLEETVIENGHKIIEKNKNNEKKDISLEFSDNLDDNNDSTKDDNQHSLKEELIKKEKQNNENKETNNIDKNQNNDQINQHNKNNSINNKSSLKLIDSASSSIINKSSLEPKELTSNDNNSKLLSSPQKKSNNKNSNVKPLTNKLKGSLKPTGSGTTTPSMMEKKGKKEEKEASSLKRLSKGVSTKQSLIEKEIKQIKTTGKVNSNLGKGKLEKTTGSDLSMTMSTHTSGVLNKRSKIGSLKSAIDSKLKENAIATKESFPNSTSTSPNKLLSKKDILRKRMYNEKLKQTSFIKPLSKEITPSKKTDLKNDLKNKKEHSLHKNNSIKKENNLIKIPNDRLSPSSSMISKGSNSPKKPSNKKESITHPKQNTTKFNNNNNNNNNNDLIETKKEEDKKIDADAPKTIEEIDSKILSLEKEINQLEEPGNKELDPHKKRKEKEKVKSTETQSNAKNTLSKKDEDEKETSIEKKKEDDQLQNPSNMNSPKKEVQKNKTNNNNDLYSFNDNTLKDEKNNSDNNDNPINNNKKEGMSKSDSTEYNISSKDKMILDSYKNLGKSSSNNTDNSNSDRSSPIKSLNSDVVFPSLVDNQGKELHDNLIKSKGREEESRLDDEDKIFNNISNLTSSIDNKIDSITKITNDYTIGVNGHLSLLNSSSNNSPTSDDINSPTVMAADQTSKRIDRILDYLKTVGNNSFEMLSDTVTDKASVKSDYDLMDSVSKYNRSAAGTIINSKLSDTASIYSLYNKDKKDNTVEVFDGVKSKIITQQMEIEEKTRSLDFLKKELKKLKDTLKDQTTQYRKDIKSKLSLQRKEYETIIKRHLSFVDKLLNEKEQLTTKCQNLGDDVKNMEKMYKQKIKELEEHHTRDIKQQKELWQASEKLRRDKWIQTKEKQIKDNTIKGLEPEIQKMLSQHKLQIKQLEESYQEKLIKEKQIILDQHQHQMEQLRDKISSERQRACEEEREFSRQRYMKQLERDEMEFQQNKRKLIMEMEEEKNIIVNQLKQEKKKEEEQLLKEIDELKKRISDLKTKNEESISEINRKNIKEINNLKEKMEIEKQEWQNLMIQKNEAELHQKEKNIKEKLMSERDAEIEMVIQRLESETNSSTSDITRQHRMEIEKLKAENADEIKKLRDEHNLSLDKIIEIQEKMKSVEDEKRQIQKELIKCQHESTIMEQQLQSQKQELSRLKVSKDALSDMIREEFKSQLELSKSNIDILNEQLNSQKAQTELLRKKNQQDIENINKEKEMALQLVEEKVHQALMTKDEVILKLKENIDELTLRNRYLEGMIEKQRIELLS